MVAALASLLALASAGSGAWIVSPREPASFVRQVHFRFAGPLPPGLGDGFLALHRNGDRFRAFLRDSQQLGSAARLLERAGAKEILFRQPAVSSHALRLAGRPAFAAIRARLRAEADAYLALPETLKSPNAKAPKRTTGYYEWYDDWFRSRAYPRGEIDFGVYSRGHRQKQALDNLAGNFPWVYIGPTNLSNGGIRAGFGPSPVNGRINAIAFDSGNPNIVYAAGGGGVWKSTNLGNSWSPRSDRWIDITSSAVATHPLIPNRVYAGSGDFPGDYSSFPAGIGIGLMVSTDAGNTWAVRGAAQFSGKLISDILVDPDHSSRLIVVAGRGGDKYSPIYRTEDEGLSWSSALSSENIVWNDLDLGIPGTGGARRFYAAGTQYFDPKKPVLYSSSDHGFTWNPVTIPDGLAGEHICVAASKVSAGTVYLFYTESRLIYRSTNFGGQWLDISRNYADVSGDYYTQSSYNNHLLCFPRTSGSRTTDALLLQHLDVYLTPSAGATDWTMIGRVYENDANTHTDNHVAAKHPTMDDVFYLGNDGGVSAYGYDAENNTGIWDHMSKSLGCTHISRIAVSPGPLDVVMTGAQDNGYPHCVQDIGNWGNLAGGDGGHVAISHSNGNYAYLMPPGMEKNEAGDSKIYRTENHWQTRTSIDFNALGERHRQNPPMAIDALNGDLMYWGTHYVHRYNRATNTVTTKLGNQVVSAEHHVRHLAVRGQRIYTVSGQGEVWTSADGGSTWTQVNGGVSPLPDKSIGHVSIDPNNTRSVLVTLESTQTGPSLYQCLDVTSAQRQWQAVNGSNGPKPLPDGPLNAIQRDPQRPKTHWYIAGELGLFMTQDAGQTWYDLTPLSLFPSVPITDIKIHPGRRVIYASTWGRGVWRRSLPPVSTLGDLKIGD